MAVGVKTKQMQKEDELILRQHSAYALIDFGRGQELLKPNKHTENDDVTKKCRKTSAEYCIRVVKCAARCPEKPLLHAGFPIADTELLAELSPKLRTHTCHEANSNSCCRHFYLGSWIIYPLIYLSRHSGPLSLAISPGRRNEYWRWFRPRCGEEMTSSA